MEQKEVFAKIKAMIEADGQYVEPDEFEREKKFFADATRAYLGKQSLTSAIQGYDPDQMLQFLSLPTKTVMKEMGEPWASMDVYDFEYFMYTMKQKVFKSKSIINWEQ